MNRINLVSFIFLALSLVTLSACKTMGGSWTYSSSDHRSAEEPPELLAQKIESFPTQQIASVQQELLNAPQNPSVETTALQAPPIIPPAEPVKVALLLPLSGEHRSLGQAMLQAAQLALFDIGNPNFELLPRDTKGTPEGAKAAAEEVISENAKLILGPVFSSSVRAVKSKASRSGVNVIGFSTDWSLAGGNTYIMGFLPFDQVERLVQYMSYKGLGNVGIIAPSSDYGRVTVSAYQSLSNHYGLERAETKYFAAEHTNLAPVIREFSQYDERNAEAEMAELELIKGIEDPEIVAEIKENMEPIEIPLPYDAVLMPMGGETALSISNLLSHYDMPPRAVQRLGTGLFDDDGLATEQSLNGAWFAAPSPRLRQSFENRYSSLYGSTPPRLTTLAYDATALAAVLAKRGIQTMGKPDFSRRSIMNPNGFAGIDGIFRFRSNGTVERGLAILEFKRGKINVLEQAPRTFQRAPQTEG